MVEGRASRRVLRCSPRGEAAEEASLPEEVAVGVRLNGQPVAALPASPLAPEELAVGHLALRGLLREPGDVRSVAVRRALAGIRVDVEGRRRRPARPAPAPRGPRLAAAEVRGLMAALLEGSALYREGGGVHTSALAARGGIVLLASDVGKVNTLDRLAGMALLRGVPPRGTALLTTGRVTGAMAARAARLGCGVVVSHSGPTTEGLRQAEVAELTLVGYARGGGFTVYAGARRIDRR